MAHTINMHTFLEVLISLILKQYFNNTFCILHYHDNPDNLVHIHRFPMMSNQIDELQNFSLVVRHKCRLFLLQCDDARGALETTEILIRTDRERRYNKRKYIIVVNSEEAFLDLFNSTDLSFIRDLLVVYTGNQTVGAFFGRVDTYHSIHTRPINDSNIITVPDHFDLYTHKFIGLEGNNDPILLDVWFPRNSSFQYGNNLFPDKVSNQYGRELRAPCMDLNPYAICDSDPPLGNEYNTIVEYAKRYNFTLNIYINDSYGSYGSISANWTGEGVLGRLVEVDNYCEIVYGGFPSRVNVDLIRSIRYSYVVSVPIARIKYGYFMFMEVFTIHVWLVIILMYLLIRLLVYFRKEYLILSRIRGTHLSTLTMYGLLINQPLVLTTDIRYSTFLKCIVIILVLSSVWLVTAYNSRLSSVMVTPVWENDVDTLTELSESNLKLLFFDEYYSIMEEDQRKVYQKLYSKIELIPNQTDYELSEEYLSSRKYAVARYRRSNGDYFEQTEHLVQMRGKYKPIVPELFTDFYYILLRKNSIHTNRLQRLMTTIYETGLFSFWENEALREANNTIFQKQVQEYSLNNYNHNLNMLHLKGIFAFWILGMFTSLIVFLRELIKKHNVTPKYEFIH